MRGHDPSNNELTPGARFRPQNPRGIHGGDFKGIENHLDYIKNLGATAIWITPVFINDASSAWHGYGALDFTTISPQLGGLAGLRDLTKAAHERGIYIILDVVLNHLGAVATSDDPRWPRFRKDLGLIKRTNAYKWESESKILFWPAKTD